MTRFFRITRVAFSAPAVAFSGVGVTMASTRWTRKRADLRGVYAADSLALSCLETLVHLDMKPRMFPKSVYFWVDVPETAIERPALKDLPKGWKADVPTRSSQDFGTAFLESRRAVAMALPTVIQEVGTNFLINPLHPAFDLGWVSGPFPYQYDSRLA